jgi:dihydroxy-acid dehydratase
MGGPIAAVRDGDIVTIDVDGRRLDVDVPAREIEARLSEYRPPPPRWRAGVFAKYAAQVSCSSEGAVTRPDLRR